MNNDNDADSNTSGGDSRRRALGLLLGFAATIGAVGVARAQTASSVDTAPLQFALNMQYLTTSFLQIAVFGSGRQLPADMIRGGELTDQPGVSMTSASQVAFAVTYRDIQARLREITDEDWGRTQTLRAILRADSPAQTLIDLSAAAFTTLLRRADAIPSTATFDPYGSPPNLVLAAAIVFDVKASALAALLPQMSNDIARTTVAALAAGAASDSATIRSMVYAQSTGRPELLTMMDRVAAWRDVIDGTSATDRALTPTGTGGTATTLIAMTDTDGLFIGRTPQQALNVLFMTAGVATRGGFYPTGINGIIKQSAAG